jgi:hypothetical protein
MVQVHSSFYQAFDCLNYPYLANLGVDVDWNQSAMLKVHGVYRPRFEVCPASDVCGVNTRRVVAPNCNNQVLV